VNSSKFNSSNDIIFEQNGVVLHLKREDKLHSVVSGNKYRKLKYNVAEAKVLKRDTILTFGGAFSNHIVATAAAGKIADLQTIGIIRGEELGNNLKQTLKENSTLSAAYAYGMQLEFVSRALYKQKGETQFLQELQARFNHPYIIPEGGTNKLAITGCEEILTEDDSVYDFICCAAGTGGTAAGILNTLQSHQKGLIFPALKGDFMAAMIRQWISKTPNWEIISDYHFGGYAKCDRTLIDFINTFAKAYQIPLDPIYTGKMMFGIFDLIEDNFFPQNSRILAIHTGGLQGINGMNKRLLRKGLPVINEVV